MLSIVYNKALNERLGKGCPVALCPSRADRPVSGHSPGVRSAACFLIRLGQAWSPFLLPWIHLGSHWL